MKALSLATLLVLTPAALTTASAAQQPLPQARYEHTLSRQAIVAVQHRLRELGFYRGRADGVWGRGTQAGLARFQESRGLEVTAQLNPATAKALDLPPEVVFGNVVRGASQVTTEPQLLSREVVQVVQHRLRREGFYRGAGDGVLGRRTAAAVERFQAARGLPANGELTPATMAALGIDPNNPEASVPARQAYRR